MTETQAPPGSQKSSPDSAAEPDVDQVSGGEPTDLGGVEISVKGWERLAKISLFVAVLGGLGFITVYWLKRLGYEYFFNQWLGFCLALAGVGIGTALIIWGKKIVPEVEVVDIHPESTDEQRVEAVETIEAGEEVIVGRRGLLGWLIAAVSAFGVAILFPVRSLGPSPNGTALTTTFWSTGMRAVDVDGRVITVDRFEVGTVLTAFPQGYAGEKRSQSLIILMEPDEIDLPSDMPADRFSVGGFVIFSKVCTHAGCPVGLYDKTQKQLVCPCHRSTFDASTGGDVVFGPAPLRLPMLPFEINGRGEFVALDDFPEPIGPAWWNRPDKSDEGDPPGSGQGAYG